MFVCRVDVEVSRYTSVVGKKKLTSRKGMVVEECELVNLMVEGMLLRYLMKIFRLSRPLVQIIKISLI